MSRPDCTICDRTPACDGLLAGAPLVAWPNHICVAVAWLTARRFVGEVLGWSLAAEAPWAAWLGVWPLALASHTQRWLAQDLPIARPALGVDLLAAALPVRTAAGAAWVLLGADWQEPGTRPQPLVPAHPLPPPPVLWGPARHWVFGPPRLLVHGADPAAIGATLGAADALFRWAATTLAGQHARGGRPRGTGTWRDAAHFRAVIGSVAQELHARGQNPTAARVRRRLRTQLGAVDAGQFTRWHQGFGWRTWAAFLADVLRD